MHQLGYRVTVPKTNANFKKRRDYSFFAASQVINLKSKEWPNPVYLSGNQGPKNV